MCSDRGGRPVNGNGTGIPAWWALVPKTRNIVILFFSSLVIPMILDSQPCGVSRVYKLRLITLDGKKKFFSSPDTSEEMQKVKQSFRPSK